MKRKPSYKSLQMWAIARRVYPGDCDQFDTIQPDLRPAFGVAGSSAQTRGRPGGSLRCRESKKDPAQCTGPSSATMEEKTR